MSTSLDELERLLEKLEDENLSIAFSWLYALSDLAGERLKLFVTAWEGLSADRRRRLIQALAELAEVSFEVNFDAIYRLGLDDPDDLVRATAVDGLWENEDQALIGPFLQLLRADPSPSVRAAAATALGRFVLAGELESLDAIIAARILGELLDRFHLADETVEVRRRAVESAAYVCSSEVSEALEIAYYDEDEEMRTSALFGMGRSCDRRWRAIILKELDSASPAMRYEAARASGELELRQAAPALARLLDDADRQIREASIWALGQMGGSEARQILTDAYQDADEETIVALDEALAEQALQEGALDFALYEVDDGLDDLSDDLSDDGLLLVWDVEEAEDDDDKESAEEEGDDDWEV
jgi:HEAT repeat protein